MKWNNKPSKVTMLIKVLTLTWLMKYLTNDLWEIGDIIGYLWHFVVWVIHCVPHRETLSQFIDCLMIRNDDHKIIRRLSSLNALPIINGLSNYSHPCQILSDLFTINESIGGIKNKQIAWIGDYNNVLRSLIQLQNLYQFKLNIVMPKEILKQNKSKIIKSINKNLMITDKIKDGVKCVDCVMTDVWVSMGESSSKKKYFKNYQVNSEVIKVANKEAIFMHCLPAHRDEEVSSELLDSKKSVVWRQAQNRMYVQQAIILELL